MKHLGSAIPLLLAACASGAAPSADDPCDTLRAVGREGRGNAAAAPAWKSLTGRGPDALIPALKAFDGASPTAGNWLRSAVEAIAEKAGPPQAPSLEAFVKDTSHDGESRFLAYEILSRLDPGAPARLLPGMLDDPGRELRREAVALAIEQAVLAPAADDLKRILGHARDKDQVDALAKHLKAVGVGVDLPSHFGFITDWTVIASFDNADAKGFGVAYGPEPGSEAGTGKGGRAPRRLPARSIDAYGTVDLNQAVGKEKAVVAYALAVVESPEARDVQVRVGTNNAVKIFLNGELLFFRDEYHHGLKMDQYVGRGRLRQGRNEVLLKICQNDQTQDWAQKWSFQARLCDALGGAVPFKIVDAAR
jgi:hypothetical protein